jgi:hypothetical protein
MPHALPEWVLCRKSLARALARGNCRLRQAVSPVAHESGVRNCKHRAGRFNRGRRPSRRVLGARNKWEPTRSVTFRPSAT